MIIFNKNKVMIITIIVAAAWTGWTIHVLNK